MTSYRGQMQLRYRANVSPEDFVHLPGGFTSFISGIADIYRVHIVSVGGEGEENPDQVIAAFVEGVIIDPVSTQ